MISEAVSCTKCKTALPATLFNRSEMGACPGCGNLLHVEVFPAIFREITAGQAGEATMEETEASCFYHPQKRAVHPCDACGRFLCGLCDCELDGRHLCPNCLESGRTKGKIKNLENRRIIYDSLALNLALGAFVPVLCYFSWLMAPAAIFVTFRYYKAPGSIVRRGKVRFVLAVILALLEIVAIVSFIILLSTKKRK